MNDKIRDILSIELGNSIINIISAIQLSNNG